MKEEHRIQNTEHRPVNGSGLSVKRSVSVAVCTLSAIAVFCVSCNIISPEHDPITYGESYISHLLSTDKAAYQPGEPVRLSINSLPESAVTIRYTHLGTVLKEEPLTSQQWTWQPPTEDFQGYMAELRTKDSVIASIGIDVSSEPSRFPRNGFLSSYGAISDNEKTSVLNDLNRYHINYVQFQDWHWKHHHPLAGSATQPMDVWTDIISRNCYRTTVQSYIDGAHERGMVTLFYNLGYGCLEDYASDGVDKEWLMYTDRQHTNMDYHPLGSPFKSAIYLTNLHHAGWREYLRARNDEVYAIFNFDGWQIDQLGDRLHPVYDYDGAEIDVQASFGPFIANEKAAQPKKRLVMNAVGQYGQKEQIAPAPVDFCYTEVWEHSDVYGYSVFSNIITDNASWSNGKQTVLAAYLNYDFGQKGRGYFNTPGIIMATAAASAWGGTILQMGEHMLCHEYFPDDNLTMTGELKRAMIRYYDFAVAYENLLRPEAPATGINSDWFGVDVTSTVDTIAFNQWGPQMNRIATVGRHVGDRDVIHLLSYRNATHLDWCDSNGDQAPQTLITDIPVSVESDTQPLRVWVATPDYRQGAAQEITDWSYHAGKLSFTLPALQYWTMIVIEK
jgi:dextranase